MPKKHLHPALRVTATLKCICPTVFLLACAGFAAASEKVTLATVRQPGDITKVEVMLQVGGELMLANAGATPGTDAAVRKLPVSVAAKLVYSEKALAVRQDITATSRALRRYDSAKALVTIDKGEQKPALSDDHRLIAVETTDGETTLICPGRSLTREELDLIDVTANTLVLEEFLPAGPVAQGDTWTHSDSLLAALLRLDAVSLADVQSMLSEVDEKQQVAKVALAGTVHGAIGGVSTEIELKAKYTFDLSQKRITLFALLIKEKRSIGHVGPGLDVVAKQIVKLAPNAEESVFFDGNTVSDRTAFGEVDKSLHFESALNRFAIDHDRRWFVTNDEKKLTVFRLVDRGELVAQCNLAPLDPPQAGQNFALADFQKDIEKSLGKKFGQFVVAKEETDARGRRVFRVVVNGTVAELPIQWVYYLLTTQSGQRLSVAFTMESPLVDRFGAADRDFVSALEIMPAQTAATGTPTPAKR
jgi:hypothetical protein